MMILIKIIIIRIIKNPTYISTTKYDRTPKKVVAKSIPKEPMSEV